MTASSRYHWQDALELPGSQRPGSQAEAGPLRGPPPATRVRVTAWPKPPTRRKDRHRLAVGKRDEPAACVAHAVPGTGPQLEAARPCRKPRSPNRSGHRWASAGGSLGPTQRGGPPGLPAPSLRARDCSDACLPPGRFNHPRGLPSLIASGRPQFGGSVRVGPSPLEISGRGKVWGQVL